MNGTDAGSGGEVRGLRRIGRMVRLLAGDWWQECGEAVAVGALLVAGMAALAAVVGVLTRPLAPSMGVMERGVAACGLALIVVFVVAIAYLLPRDLYRALRRAWLRAGQTEPEYGVPSHRGFGWDCPRCEAWHSEYQPQCVGRSRWHVPVLRPEEDR